MLNYEIEYRINCDPVSIMYYFVVSHSQQVEAPPQSI
jgi:hypothetical protein